MRAFNGASVEFIRRFQRRYDAEISYLVENYRSAQHINTATNQVIQPRHRMKIDHPTCIDVRRADPLAGGRWSSVDPENRGRVRHITAPRRCESAAQLVAAGLRIRLPGCRYAM